MARTWYIDKYLNGGCLVCGGDERDDRLYAHNRCWFSLTPAESEEAVKVAQARQRSTGPRIVLVQSGHYCYTSLKNPDEQPNPGETWEPFNPFGTQTENS